MHRSDRMQPVRQLKHQAEQQEAKRLAQRLQELKQAERQMGELHQYRQDYYQMMQQPQQIHSATQLQKYQGFLSRLNTAIERQQQTLLLKKQAVDQQRKAWADAKAKVQAMDDLIARMRQEEQLHADKLEQKSMDELANQRAARRVQDGEW